MRKKRERKHKDEDKQRFYLLPGQGGKAYRRKQKIILAWSAVAALIVSAIFAGILYLVNHSNQ